MSNDQPISYPDLYVLLAKRPDTGAYDVPNVPTDDGMVACFFVDGSGDRKQFLDGLFLRAVQLSSQFETVVVRYSVEQIYASFNNCDLMITSTSEVVQ